MKQAIATVLMIITFLSGLSAQNAYDIVKKSVDKQTGRSSRTIMTMEVIRPTWSREMKITSWTLGQDYTMMLITAPARDAGTAFLKRKNEIWNWQPRIQRTIKLPPSMMTQSWMGSDFTNDDLVKQSSMIDDYSHKLNGSEVLEGYDCYVITLTPKADAAVIWGKIILWIDKKEYMEMKAEFYDEDNELVNTMNGRSPKLMDGMMLPSILEVIPADKEGERTVVTMNDLEFDIDVNESFFTEQEMKRLRP